MALPTVEEEKIYRLAIERERCAKIAEAMAAKWFNDQAVTPYGQGYQTACEHIAAAIRTQSRL